MFDIVLRLFKGDRRPYAPIDLISLPLRSSEIVYKLSKCVNGISII